MASPGIRVRLKEDGNARPLLFSVGQRNSSYRNIDFAVDFVECSAQNTGPDSDISVEMMRLSKTGLAVAKTEAEKVAWTGHF